MLRTLLVILTLVVGQIAYAQTIHVSGLVQSDAQVILPYASVVLLQAQDSVIHQFGITDDSGAFSFKNVPHGNYLLQLSFVGYQDFSKPVSVSGEGTIDFGKLTMLPKVNTLDEFVVAENIVPIKIKGDTVEYNAAAFQTKPNDAVEDLLKKLPGVQVDKDGNIKAQGEDVQRVFVDGKEFFGDDPKIATKNLPADAIDKVQVYDKKSDEAEFTGLDDGVREKTINLMLKEDKKNGMFGKVEGGYGTKDRYKGKININRFDAKTQVSALGMANNTNEQGFSIQDYISFMGGIQKLMDSGGMTLGSGGMQVQMPGSSSGIAKTMASGINFNHDFSKKTQLFSNYFFNGVNTHVMDENNRNTFYEKRETNEFTTTNSNNESYNHRLNLKLNSKIDSMNEFRITASGSFNTGNATMTSNQLLSDNLEQKNVSDRQNKAESMSYDGSFSARQIHKFAKKGRSGSVKLNADLSNSNGKGNVYLNTQQSLRDTVLFNNILFQDNTDDQKEQVFGSTLSFTEPLGKGHFVTLSTRTNWSNKTSKRLFYDANSHAFIDSLSRTFENTYAYVNGGLAWKINKKDNSFAAGLNMQVSTLTGEVIGLGDEVVKNFVNALPFLNFNLRPASGKNVNFYYSTSVNAPTIAQLQPIVDNSNPLSLYQGNPNLKQEYVHSSSLSFSHYNQFSFSSWNSRLSATYTEDKIINQVSIDDNFVKTTQPINTDDNLALRLSAGYSKEIKKVTFEIDGSSQYTKGILLTDQVASSTQNYIQSAGISFGNRKKAILDLTLGAQVSENKMRYENNLNLNNTGYEYNIYADLGFNITKKLAFEGSYDYTIYKNNVLSNQSFPMLKASLSQLMMKDDRGELKLSVFDALNRNQGVNYTNELNYTQNTRSNVLNRYYMISFVYSLSKFGGDEIEFKESRR